MNSTTSGIYRNWVHCHTYPISMIFTCTNFQGGNLRNWVHKMLEMYNQASSNVCTQYLSLTQQVEYIEIG
jgi:hypothetical protein